MATTPALPENIDPKILEEITKMLYPDGVPEPEAPKGVSFSVDGQTFEGKDMTEVQNKVQNYWHQKEQKLRNDLTAATVRNTQQGEPATPASGNVDPELGYDYTDYTNKFVKDPRGRFRKEMDEYFAEKTGLGANWAQVLSTTAVVAAQAQNERIENMFKQQNPDYDGSEANNAVIKQIFESDADLRNMGFSLISLNEAWNRAKRSGVAKVKAEEAPRTPVAPIPVAPRSGASGNGIPTQQDLMNLPADKLRQILEDPKFASVVSSFGGN